MNDTLGKVFFTGIFIAGAFKLVHCDFYTNYTLVYAPLYRTDSRFPELSDIQIADLLN